jgi:hypothetical protein
MRAFVGLLSIGTKSHYQWLSTVATIREQERALPPSNHIDVMSDQHASELDRAEAEIRRVFGSANVAEVEEATAT